MPVLETCLTPDLFHHYDVAGKTVVVIDVFRATSTIVAALDAGLTAVKPVEHVEEAAALRDAGWLAGSERGGQKVEGFDYGNSPLEYQSNPDLPGKKLVLTTTNGTKITIMSDGAEEIVCGAMINISAVEKYIRKVGRDVVLFCAGWKGRVNFEDTLFAGALADRLVDQFEIEDDSTLIARAKWQTIQHDMKEWVVQCSHAKRLTHKGMLEDVRFCLLMDVCDVAPVLRNGEFVKG